MFSQSLCPSGEVQEQMSLKTHDVLRNDDNAPAKLAGPSGRTDAGRGLMEVIVGVLVLAIVSSIFLHVIRLGIAMFTLNSATSDVAQQLTKAREMAVRENKKVTVIFDVDQNKYGIDRNSNGRLDTGEAEDLPQGIAISEAAVISFLPSGKLPPKTKPPQILISNDRNSKKVSVSALGSVEIE
jgi:hypothetical protein